MLGIMELAKAMWHPWEKEVADEEDFADIWDGDVLQEALEDKSILPGDILFLQFRDGFCPLGNFLFN